MALIRGPAVITSAEDCRELGPQLAEAIRLGWTVRGRQPPRLLLEHAGQVSAVGRSAARFRADAQVSAGNGTGEVRSEPVLAVSEQPVRLNIREAAQLAGISEGYMRRCCRRGDVQASQGCRGWAVDIASVGAWMSSQRRRERDRKAA